MQDFYTTFFNFYSIFLKELIKVKKNEKHDTLLYYSNDKRKKYYASELFKKLRTQNKSRQHIQAPPFR